MLQKRSLRRFTPRDDRYAKLLGLSKLLSRPFRALSDGWRLLAPGAVPQAGPLLPLRGGKTVTEKNFLRKSLLPVMLNCLLKSFVGRRDSSTYSSGAPEEVASFLARTGTEPVAIFYSALSGLLGKG